MITWQAIGRRGHYGTLSATARTTTTANLFTASYGGDRIKIVRARVENYQNSGAVSVTFSDGRSIAIPAYANMYIDCSDVDILSILNYGSTACTIKFFDREALATYLDDSVSFDPTTISINDLLFRFNTDVTTNSGSETRGSVTVAGTVASDTSDLIFGSASMRMNDDADSWTYTNGSFFPINTATDWTLDFWLKPRTMAAGADAPYFVNIYSATKNVAVRLDDRTSYKLQIEIDSVVAATESVASMAGGNWYHVALTCKAGTLRLFVSGTLVATATLSSGSATANKLQLGDQTGAIRCAIDYIDELRYTKAEAVWIANFTPPSSPYN